MTVWNKANVAGRLKGELTEEEFQAVSRIIYGLFDEGPVRGISAIEDVDKRMADYLKQFTKHEPLPDAYDTVQALHGWAESVESPEIIAMCEEIMQSA